MWVQEKQSAMDSEKGQSEKQDKWGRKYFQKRESSL